MTSEISQKNSLTTHALSIIIALVIQYILGMTTALFVSFPEGAQDKQLWEFAWTQLPLALHIIVGLVLFIGSAALVVRAIRHKDRQWTIASSIGFAAILIAGIMGAKFIPTQVDGYSYVMALAFIVAFVAYGWGLTRYRHY